MFGGGVGDFINPTNELWLFDYNNDNWTEVITSDGPSGRLHPNFDIIPKLNVLVLFGGSGFGLTKYRDFWFYHFDNNSWVEQSVIGLPSEIASFAKVKYNPENGNLLFFQFPNVFEYDLNTKTWVQLVNNSEIPSVGRTDIVYDLINKKFVIFGGWDGNKVNGDTWLFDYSTKLWTKLSSNVSPIK